MEVVWNTEALVQCGGAPGTLRILRVFARFQPNTLRFFYAISRELRVSKVCGNKLKFSNLSGVTLQKRAKTRNISQKSHLKVALFGCIF